MKSLVNYYSATIIGTLCMLVNFVYLLKVETYQGDFDFFINVIITIVFGWLSLLCFKKTDGIRKFDYDWVGYVYGTLFGLLFVMCALMCYNSIQYLGETIIADFEMTETELEQYCVELRSNGFTNSEIIQQLYRDANFNEKFLTYLSAAITILFLSIFKFTSKIAETES